VPRWSPAETTTTLRERRPVYFAGDWTRACPVYDRYALRPGARVRGPAVVEERESTTIVPPGARLLVDDDLNLVTMLPRGARS
jgi:N-methylhydantoinase A/oxoprolinase/acetone carboxylase beta subunit